MSKLSAFALSAVLATTFAVAASATPPSAPRLSITSIDQLAQPLPYPYDEQADARAAVARAKAQAKREHKRLLIDLGGNWCGDCRVLAGVLDQPELKAFIARHFVVVAVDIGRYDKNGNIAAHYGIARIQGVPAILAIDPVHDRLLNNGRFSALSDARYMTPQALADWLAQWAT